MITQQKMTANNRTFGPVADLERHLTSDWWRTLFNAFYLKTDGDVVENSINTSSEIDLLIRTAELEPHAKILDLCCGQGRHSIELAKRGFMHVTGIDRSRYLIRLARKRAKNLGLNVRFAEGDARKIRLPAASQDCVALFGNSFGYFEKKEDDIGVLQAVKRLLKPAGTLVLDIADGAWLRDHFQPRSWEWIDQNHFVCRERSLSSDGTRIISREVIVHAEDGVIVDQFYAERLYTYSIIADTLLNIGFSHIVNHSNVRPDSSRNQDLGMMANRLFITANAPEKKVTIIPKPQIIDVTVILGDPQLPDKIKKNSQFNSEDFAVIATLQQTLQKLLGYRFTYISNHQTLINQLLAQTPGLILNLCDEGFNNEATKELHVPALLEMLNIPYSGADPTCLAICYNKTFVHAIAASLNIPVPYQTYVDSSDQAASMPSIFPALLKPNCGDSSIGITREAVVDNAEQLISYLNYLQQTLPGTPILIQEFLAGPEYSVGLIGNNGNFEALPILGVDYSDLPAGLPHILPYESKWVPESPYWTKIKYKEAQLDEESRRKLIDYAIVMFERLGCRDYARFDFRADKQGVIKLLEVNPNPGWVVDGKLNLMASFAGISYEKLLSMILQATKERVFKADLA